MSRPIRLATFAAAAAAAAAILALLIAIEPVEASSVHRVPGDFSSIGEAIAGADDGDLILVGPGVWEGALDFRGQSVAVVSMRGPEETVIDAGEAENAVVFAFGEDSRARLDGFSIVGTGRGILCDGSEPRITGNILRDLVAPDVEPFGAAILCQGGASPEIIGNVISGNRAAGRPFSLPGGAISCLEEASPRIENNWIQGNVIEDGDGGGVGALNASPQISGNRFENNQGRFGDGIFLSFPNQDTVVRRNRFIGQELDLRVFSMIAMLTIESNVFEGKLGPYVSQSTDALLRGNRYRSSELRFQSVGNVRFVHETLFATRLVLDRAPASATNSILYGLGREPVELMGDATFEAEFCDIEGGWPGTGNIDADPLFLNAPRGDFRLRPESPCVDAGTEAEASPEADFEGESRSLPGRPGQEARADIGADEMELGVAVRFGKVGAGSGPLAPIEDVLFANGSSGDARRELRFSLDESVVVDVLPPSSGPTEAPFVIYAFPGVPSLDSVVEQPGELGWAGFGTPLRSNGLPRLLAKWNNIGRPRRLGRADRPSEPAPTRLFRIDPGTFDRARAVTLQGFILDEGSASPFGASTTNAVSLVFLPPGS